MAYNYKVLALGVIALGGMLTGAYVMGTKHGAPDATSPSLFKQAAHGAPRPTQIAQAGKAQPPGAAPAVHPAAEPASSPTEGKVGANQAPNAPFTHFRVGNKNVKRIFLDGDKVWVGTSGGLIRYASGTDEYKLYDTRSGLLSNGVFHVGKLQGRIVVGTYGGGMSLLDASGEKWETFNIPEGLGDAFVYDVLEAANGDVWIATWSGVNRVRGGALRDRSKWELHTVESTRKGLPNDWVYGLAEGRNGDIWLATEGGVALYRKGVWESWNHARGLGAPYDKVKDAIEYSNDPAKVSSHHAKQKEEMGLQNINVAYNPNYVIALAVDKSGVTWAGTWGGGLARYDGKRWHNLTVADGLPGNHVFLLHVDAKGQLWVGSNKGLARMENGKFKLITTKDGLFADAVFSMASTERSIWVGSFGGVAQIRDLK